MKKTLTELENVLTNLKLKARKLKKENDDLKFKVNLLLTVISLELITWLVIE